MEQNTNPLYSPAFDEALAFAADVHRHQRRKGSELPYITHLFGVCTLVWQYGGDETQAIAGLLHDSVEDGGAAVLGRIREKFGDRVAGIVNAASDSVTDDPADKAPWRERKERHVEHAAEVSSEAALVIGCDKLHNLTNTVADYERDGAEVFDKFNGGADGTRWYYRAMRDALEPKLPAELVKEIDIKLTALGA